MGMAQRQLLPSSPPHPDQGASDAPKTPPPTLLDLTGFEESLAAEARAESELLLPEYAMPDFSDRDQNGGAGVSSDADRQSASGTASFSSSSAEVEEALSKSSPQPKKKLKVNH